MSDLRSRLVRLAHANPSLRSALLPLLVGREAGLDGDLVRFNQSHPYHRDLEAIDAVGGTRRAIVGDVVPWARVRPMVRLGLVVVAEGPFGREVTLTDRGHRYLVRSREAFLDL